ncbi:unnamed protein product [Adineta ricciae]|uniref:Uncharacterized protein n=1 Tax=Adineta ricciae TaxID=249248 RepID=A0A814XNU5_ADIRI|nr:unnamed protein product [Adineta ricciae]CAF1217265.1 unnamed protein product [Adineta ricciae]
MNDLGRRVNSIIVKNLPTNYNESQLEELFSKFGRIVSSKVLPSNPNFDGGCGFVNYAEAESCARAVEAMNNFVIDRFTLRVNHSSTRMNGSNPERPQNGFHTNGESTDERNGTLSPSIPSRFSGFRSASARSSTNATPSKQFNTSPNTNESETMNNNNKPLWNGIANAQQALKSPSQSESTMTVREHDSFMTNKTSVVYLSNLEVPNIIFAATVEDYVNATLLITQMNKHEQLTKVQADAYKSKLSEGQWCAALFNGDWYRARVLEVEESRVRVQYIDWGNTGWCDSILEIRPLPNEYYKDPVLCVKCILDGIPIDVKLSDEQTNAILDILVLDVKLEMTVLHSENGIPYIQLNFGERNLNSEILAILPASIPQKSSQVVNSIDSQKAEVSTTEIHSVQLTTVDTESECFHVLLIRDCLPTIMNVLKDWDASKQPLTAHPQPNTLICAQYEGDDLWYRAWIKNVNETGVDVYFVDFGNEELVSFARLSECPDILRNIPWQSVQIRLANIKLTDDERYLLLRDFETDRLNMKILSKDQDVYMVELNHNGKSLTEYMLDLRKKKEQPAQKSAFTNEVPKQVVEQTFSRVDPVPSVTKTETFSQVTNEIKRSESQSVQPSLNETKSFTPINNNIDVPSSTITSTKPPSTLTKTAPFNDHTNENLITMITEQRRQNRLLEQVIAAVNTTNALLTQLVQR